MGKDKEQREVHLDLLRILALLAVISVHCTENPEAVPTTDLKRQFLILLDAVMTWQIPIYVMISGRFFLDPERPVTASRLMRAVRRILIAFLFWSPVYQLYYLLTGAYSGLNWKGILTMTVIGPYHFWFLFMIVFLYAITPFLREIVKNRKLAEYFILLFAVFSFLTGYGDTLPAVGSVVAQVVDRTNFHFALGYAGYFVLGDYLHRYPPTKRQEGWFYAAGIAMLVITASASVHRAALEGFDGQWYTGYLKPNIILISCAVYVFFCSRVSRVSFSSVCRKVITELSANSFGVYLVHALAVEGIGILGLSSLKGTPWIIHPVKVMLVFVLSNAVIALIRKIPFIGKTVV